MSIYRGTFNVPKKISPDLDLNGGAVRGTLYGYGKDGGYIARTKGGDRLVKPSVRVRV